MERRIDPGRVLILATTGVLVLAGILELLWLFPYIASQNAVGSDLAFFQQSAQRWLVTGQLYLPRQLAGPYAIQTDVDFLYPPIALYLFVPFLWLPSILWWAIPIGIIAASIAILRPARWTWPLIAAGLVWPTTVSQVIYGNTNMWVAAAIAAGVLLAWPSVLVLIKPSLLPFAFVGVRRRRWWAGLAVLGVAALPFGALWVDYVTATRNSSAGVLYALMTVPLFLVPLVAWFGRTRGRAHALGGWPARTWRRKASDEDAAAQHVPHVDDVG